MEKDFTIESIKTFKKDLKRHLVNSLICFVIYLFVMAIGALTFFYIEHCYDVTPTKLGIYQQHYFNMCHLVQEHNEKQTYVELGNISSSLPLIDALVHMCEGNKLEIEVPKCELDLQTYWKWTIYCNTLGYTIGYGNIVTRSSTGRIVTLLYALPAIAITMTLNIYIGSAFVDGTKILLVILHSKILKIKTVRKLALKVFSMQVFITVIICVVYAALLQKVDVETFGSSFTDAIYYSFVTFTTIGFGDLLLDHNLFFDEDSFHYWLIGFFVFYIGMGVVASALTGLSELFTKDKREAKRKKKPFLMRILKKTKNVEKAAKEEDATVAMSEMTGRYVTS